MNKTYSRGVRIPTAGVVVCECLLFDCVQSEAKGKETAGCKFTKISIQSTPFKTHLDFFFSNIMVIFRQH